ncbi:MAG: hypothetical protein H3C48_15725, partial [Chitinophagaceae bacterium]|nr:hypothetical protein [Chitinophagaceae bacterium]
WEGYLTLKLTDEEGEYRFSVSAQNSFKLWIDEDLILNAFPNDPVYFNNVNKQDLFSKPVKLQHGKAYKLRIEHTVGKSGAFNKGKAILNWKKPNAASPVVLKSNNLHATLAAAQAAIKTNQTRCITWEGIRPSANTLYEELSPKAAERYLVSAWVKEQQDCKCENYVNASIEVAFIGNQGNEIAQRAILKPAGNIIEGWQRIEEIISIPQETSKIQIYFKAAQGNGNTGKIYFDDWRFLPYHGNMKSFVYHPVNLRLMSELDENNYATFYEYDDEGTLIRVKKESERGIQTIRETRSSLRKD